MKNNKSKILMGVLIAILAIGIGYAAVSSINLVIEGSATATKASDSEIEVPVDPSNPNGATGTFKVVFKSDTLTSNPGTVSASVQNETTAGMSVTGLKNVNDSVYAIFTIKNESDTEVLGDALLSVTTTNSDETHFTVTPTLTKATLATGEETTVKVEVKLKAAVEEETTATFRVKLQANYEEA